MAKTDIKNKMEVAEPIEEEDKLTKRQRIIAARKLQLQRQKRAYGKQPRSLR
tara:strand:- start:179 stop:334 length:156 start_codon:yes stop_codon:yes gene_type:complete